jgi:surface protein
MESLDNDSSNNEEQELEFVKPLTDIVDYRKDQEELVNAAIKISGGDSLSALKYIVTSLSHNNNKNIEFELVVCFNNEKSSEIWLPIIETEPNDELGFYVNWGDGSITHNEIGHEYDTSKHKNFNIKFFGLGIEGFGYVREYDYSYLGFTEIISFGNLGHKFTSLEGACCDCKSLTSVPKIIPSSVTNISYMFYGCWNFNQSINSWDTKNITNMSGLFGYCRIFNQPLDSWDTRSVTYTKYMFYGCRKFNQPLNTWNTGRIKNMQGMFDECNDFNQPLNLWDTSSVTNMSGMFFECFDFNQPLNSWNTSSVTNMSKMFEICVRFNQPLDKWDTSSVDDMEDMFTKCHDFDQSLASWKFGSMTNTKNMFDGCLISEDNKPVIRKIELKF